MQSLSFAFGAWGSIKIQFPVRNQELSLTDREYIQSVMIIQNINHKVNYEATQSPPQTSI